MCSFVEWAWAYRGFRGSLCRGAILCLLRERKEPRERESRERERPFVFVIEVVICLPSAIFVLVIQITNDISAIFVFFIHTHVWQIFYG